METGSCLLKMKLRIKGNSIRLRLLRNEVERFAAAGQVSETIEFGAGPSSFLRYSLVVSPEATSQTAQFRGNEITITVPEKIARNWTASDQVGIESEQSLGDGESLTILIEKDFACLDRPDDPDREDAFPNPNLACEQTQ